MPGKTASLQHDAPRPLPSAWLARAPLLYAFAPRLKICYLLVQNLPMRLLLLLLVGGLLCQPIPIHGQEVLAQLELEDFETDDDNLFPYLNWGPSRLFPFITLDPALRLSDGTLAQLWRPDKLSSRLRCISRYDLLLDEKWTTEFELDRGEDIWACLEYSPDTLVILSLQQEYFQNRFLVKTRMVNVATGKVSAPNLLEVVDERSVSTLFFTQSRDGGSFAVYYFTHQSTWQRASVDYEYIDRHRRAGYRVYRASEVHFSVYDHRLERLRQDRMSLPDRRHVLLGCFLGEDASFFAYLHQRKQALKILRSPSTGPVQTLAYQDGEDLPQMHELEEGYEGHLPPALGRQNRVYWTIAERDTRGRDRGTKSYTVLCFDFEREEVDRRRRVEITSSLLVAVEKQREAYQLRPLKRFDEYSIRDVFEMPDGSVWLVVQQYKQTEYPQINAPSSNAIQGAEERIEEMVLFAFDPAGAIQQALIVPTVQYLRSYEDRLGAFYHMYIDSSEKVMHLLPREAAGEKFRDPDRLYHRRIDMESGLISPRQLFFEGERRRQYWPAAYTTWITPSILTFICLDGENGKAYLVSVDVDAEPVPDEEARRD
jgi:hypothetical protein